MKKKYAMLALAALTMAACNNEEESTLGNGNVQALADLDPVIVYTVGNTREAMSMDLVNTWVNGDALGMFSQWDKNRTGDVNQYVNNGTQNARFQFYNTFTLNGTTYTNRWAQDGLLSGTPLTAATAVTWNASNLNFDTKYNFYVYYPYAAGATQTAVPFTLSSQQTQNTPDEWTNSGSDCYNFLYCSNTDMTRPADRKLPFDLARLLPVAKFDIIRDNNKLDDYTLNSIVVKPTSGSMATGTTTINLLTVGTASTTSVYFNSTASQYQLNSNIAMNNVAMNKSVALYMSLPPTASKEYTITATFSRGVDIKKVVLTRSDAFTITNGKGNLVQYNINASNATTGTTSEITGSVGEELTIGSTVWARSNVVYIDHIWRFAETLDETYPNTTSEDGKCWTMTPEEGGSKRCFFQYGELLPVGPGTWYNGTSTSAGASAWSRSLDPCEQIAPTGTWRVPTVAELGGLSNYILNYGRTVTVNQNGRNYVGRLVGSIDANGGFTAGSSFFPYTGQIQWNTGILAKVGSILKYWSNAWGTGSVNARDMWFEQNYDGTVTTGTSADQAQRYGSTIRCVKR